MDIRKQVTAMSTEEIGSVWSKQKAALKDLREYVDALENELDRRMFPNVEDKITMKRAIGNGWELKRTQNTTISVKTAYKDLQQINSAFADNRDTVATYLNSLFDETTSVKIKKAEYNKLPDDVKREVEKVLTFTRNKPKLELVPPKQKA